MSLDVAPSIDAAPPAPVVATAPMERLDPRYVPMQRKIGGLWSAAMAAFWLAVTLSFAFLLPMTWVWRSVLLSVWGLFAVGHIVWNQYKPVLAYRHSSFRLDAEGIEIRRGVFFRSVISVPRSRVQHTDVSQGPFERRHGLGTLQIFTAGVMHAHVPLDGLAHERALEIRDALLPHERAAKADPSLHSG